MSDKKDDWSIDNLNELGQNAEYSPFHPDLDKKYPVDEMVNPESKKQIIDGEVERLAWVSVFRNSPAGKMESEALIGHFVEAAVKAGQWIDVHLSENQRYGIVESPWEPIDFSAFKLEFGKGTQKLCDIGFTEKVLDDDG